MASDINQQLQIESVHNYWIHTGRDLSIFGVHAFAVVPILILLFSWHLWTLGLVVVTIATLVVMRYFQYTPIVAFYALRSRMAGSTVKRNRRFGQNRIWK